LPNKLDPYKSYGVKLISLFARLMFSSESHSLTDLARMLGCSKQTVLRLVDDIRRAYGVEIEESFQERRKYFRLKKRTGKTPAIPFTSAEIMTLKMCKAFAEHLLGPELLREATQAIEKSGVSIDSHPKEFSDIFAVLPFGAIDYTPHQDTLRVLILAMAERKICRVGYKAAYDGIEKDFFIKPLKLFSYKDCLYLSAQLARSPGSKYRKPDFDPLLAVHRITHIFLTDRQFTYPKNYDFKTHFNNGLGVIKEKPFAIEVEFNDWAAKYISERLWDKDQVVSSKTNGSVRLKFKASSTYEAISWLLSFRDNFKIIKPIHLKNQMKKISSQISENN
jgi:predicted DNA-binding transcriptional regulator YafY